jgi:nicotinate phosphoribosyltransferase
MTDSLLDSDQYKFTMQQAAFFKFPDTKVEYEFKNRTKGVDLLPYKEEIEKEIWKLGTLKFKPDELTYLSKLRYMKPCYIDYLKNFRLDPNHITIYEKDGQLGINISGNWLDTILFEVPILAIVSEIYCNYTNPWDGGEWFSEETPSYKNFGMKNFKDKVQLLEKYPNLRFADFGTRRRHSFFWQDTIIKNCVERLKNNFVGTSNVYFAKKYNTTPIGTMAHEWIMAGQGMEEHTSVKYSQQYMLQKWAEVYRGDLGIALSDTLGFDAFLNDFDMYFAKLFDGCRHDSGDPYVWCNKLIQHYEQLRIDPFSKTAIFSDGLTFPKMIELFNAFSDRIKVSFGIGTNLTNDCGIKPLQIVIKMTKCNGRPVAKISDSKGKQMCEDKEYLRYLASRFDIPKERVE